jgi:hypothetical protein
VTPLFNDLTTKLFKPTFNLEMKIKDQMFVDWIALLRNAGVVGIDIYKKKLRDNAGNREVSEDLLSEARAALMFSRHEFKVTMRESPDLRIEIGGEVAYAEVKHFREKEQDRIDMRNMEDSESDDLVQVGNTIPTEGCAAWKQLAQVAIDKANRSQYKEGVPNLLVIETDSDSVNGVILQTAVNIYNEKALCFGPSSVLRRLNGFILIDLWIYPDKLEGFGARSGNVVFHQTRCVAIPLGPILVNALANILKG